MADRLDSTAAELVTRLLCLQKGWGGLRAYAAAIATYTEQSLRKITIEMGLLYAGFVIFTEKGPFSDEIFSKKMQEKSGGKE